MRVLNTSTSTGAGSIEGLHKSNNGIDKDIEMQRECLLYSLQNKTNNFERISLGYSTLRSRDGVGFGGRSFNPIHFLDETAAPERRAIFVYIFEKFFMVLCTRRSVHSHSLVDRISNLL